MCESHIIYQVCFKHVKDTVSIRMCILMWILTGHFYPWDTRIIETGSLINKQSIPFRVRCAHVRIL